MISHCPLEHREGVIKEDTVKSNLNTHRASRNFRNYWKYCKEGWDEFAEMISETWPGMQIQPPEQQDWNEPLTMFVKEDRIDREIYWAGFGFQVWCQMLTHIFRASESALVVIDEPEIYLHPDVQRQLLGILRRKRTDILIATHSVEIMAEAEPAEILLIDKKSQTVRRLRDDIGVQQALNALGSIQNITLANLARTNKILFAERNSDNKIIRRFAGKFNLRELESGNDITFLESGGFSAWEKVKAFSWGIKKAINSRILVAGIYDRDYFCSEHIEEIKKSMESELFFAHIHQKKEIENYLLNPTVLQRVLEKQIKQREIRTGKSTKIIKGINEILEEIVNEKNLIGAPCIWPKEAIIFEISIVIKIQLLLPKKVFPGLKKDGNRWKINFVLCLEKLFLDN